MRFFVSDDQLRSRAAPFCKQECDDRTCSIRVTDDDRIQPGPERGFECEAHILRGIKFVSKRAQNGLCIEGERIGRVKNQLGSRSIIFRRLSAVIQQLDLRALGSNFGLDARGLFLQRTQLRCCFAAFLVECFETVFYTLNSIAVGGETSIDLCADFFNAGKVLFELAIFRGESVALHQEFALAHLHV